MSAAECVFCNYFKVYVKPDLDRRNQLKGKNYLMWLDKMYNRHLAHLRLRHKNQYRNIYAEIQA